ncbi:MAG: CBS domain-containing protein [Methanoregula sp.]|uniref:CBS domain-containing protein n=1 Tax=Methanoregula sp. TaxID=2052170 RepID=UPI0025DFC7CB|nr:CBS domain-containing protein [Methanoregula sp.]MCK9632749.1 CBS domain-containing protein [Methanoregula sp.]
MDGSFRIGRIFGIPIQIHYTFLLVIPLFAWIIGSQITLTIDMLGEIYQVPIDTTLATAGYMPYVLGTIVAFGLFFGVLVHELAHSLVARAKGIGINNITLMIFGGVATMEEGVPDPKAELPMALVGPIASLVFGIACSLLIYVVPSVTTDPGMAGVLVFILGYLGVLNIILCVFNLLPAFPMDGGRVLRAWLAGRMPLHRATQIAADVGKGFAILFGIIGLFAFSPFLILIALFIYIGANMESTAVKYSHLLQDVTVGSMMSTPVTTVGPTVPVSQIIEMMYSSKHLGFPVVERDTLVGMITLADVNRTSSIDREAMQVRDIMTRDLITLPPEAPVIDALRIMSAKDIGRIPVVTDGKILGIVTRTDILKVTELRQV